MAPRLLFFPVLILLAVVATGTWAQDAGVRGFVSVEPFEFRLEALARVEAWEKDWSLGPEIRKQDQEALLARFEEEMSKGVEVSDSGRKFSFAEKNLRFVRYEAERGYVPDLRESIPLAESLVGITFSAPERGVRQFQLEWRWLAPGQERIAVEVASRGKPAARLLEAASPRMIWRLEGDAGELPTLRAVPGVQRELRHPYRKLLYPGLALAAGGAVAVAIGLARGAGTPAWAGWLFVVGLALTGVAWRQTRNEVVLPQGAALDELVYALLRNTYHAFDFREEPSIYDTLAASVSGPLLERVYLEMRASLELESDGGPRVRVHEVALRRCEPAGRTDDGEGLETRAEWVTIGEVTHWGHTHERTNRYEARLSLVAAEQGWKIGALDLLNEERIQKVTRAPGAEADPGGSDGKPAGDGPDGIRNPGAAPTPP